MHTYRFEILELGEQTIDRIVCNPEAYIERLSTLQGRPCSSTVICRFDGEPECDGAEDGAGRGSRILSRSLADTCGTELSGNRVNES